MRPLRWNQPVSGARAYPRCPAAGGPSSTSNIKHFRVSSHASYGRFMTPVDAAAPSPTQDRCSPYEMYAHMVKVHGLKVTSSGQISLPAEIRRRWQADEVLLIDKGDHVLVRPAPQDAVAQLRGSLPSGGVTADEVPDEGCALEAGLEEERWSSSTPPR